MELTDKMIFMAQAIYLVGCMILNPILFDHIGSIRPEMGDLYLASRPPRKTKSQPLGLGKQNE